MLRMAVEYQGFWGSFFDIIWWFISAFVFVAYLFLLFACMMDIFRDHKLNGWFKAIWLLFLIFVPFLTALVYLIARGRGMSRRSAEAAKAMQDAQEQYIQSVAGTSPADEIAKAKALHEAGTITDSEFEALKTQALHGTKRTA